MRHDWQAGMTHEGFGKDYRDHKNNNSMREGEAHKSKPSNSNQSFSN